MKNVIFIFLFAISCAAYAETTTSAEARFTEGSCYEQSENCEFTDFRGKTHAYWFGSSIQNPEESIYNNIPFYVGKTDQSNSCGYGLCTNAANEVIGLDPEWGPFSKEFSKQQNASQPQQPVQQQASEPPYRIESGDGKLYFIPIVESLTFNKITVNKGKGSCMGFPNQFRKKPVTVSMGVAMEVMKPNSCNIVLIEVETDKGAWEHTVN